MCFVIYVPLCWIRKIETFNWSHIFADILIISTILIIITYGLIHLKNNGWGEGVVAVNYNTYFNMIGFAVYSYEGIGVILPIMDTMKDEKQFLNVLYVLLISVFLMYIIFGLFCYFVYGNLL